MAKSLKAPRAVCDRCGIAMEVTKLKKEWTGFMVCEDCWGIKPEQRVRFSTVTAVPNARPQQSFTPGETTLTADAAKDATSVTVASVSGLGYGQPIGIEMNGNIGYHWTTVASAPVVLTVTLSDPLYRAASSGNTVIVPGGMGAASVADMTEAERKAALY